MRARSLLPVFALMLTGCPGDSTDPDAADFCMQWVNTSTRVVEFRAVDAAGTTLSTQIMQVPSLGGAFASPKIHLTGTQPITFSTTNGFSPITIRPSRGGNIVLIVEAHTVNAPLEHYEDTNGQCP
jgi:hypothetical protein